MEHDSSHLAAPSSGRTCADAAPNAPSAHTPGPWGIDHGASRFDVFCEENGWLVAQVSKPSVQSRGKERREDLAICTANARLIAAAPELLEACLAMAAWDAAEKNAKPYDEDGGAGFYARIALVNDAFDKTRAAIAKALGTPTA